MKDAIFWGALIAGVLLVFMGEPVSASSYGAACLVMVFIEVRDK